MGDVIRFPGPQRALPIQGQPKTAPRPRETKPAYQPTTICWACGTNRSERGRDYCTACSIKGLDTPLIPCSSTGCNTVTRRRIRGQNQFTCAKHRKDRA